MVTYVLPELITAKNQTPSYRLKLDGMSFDFLTAGKDYGLKYLGNDTLRFELRDADQFSWDQRSGTTSERNQIASKTLFANKQPVEVSFGFNLEQGAPNTAKWLVLGQLHLAEWTGNLTGNSPPFEIGMSGEKMMLTVRYTGADGKAASKVIYTDNNNIVRGHNYDIDVKAVFDPDGNGRVVVTRDGVIIADYSGPLGYQGQTKVLWGEGLYREGSAKETISAQFSNLDIKTDAAVKFPAADAFIDAPKLVVDKVGAAAADGSRSVVVSGTAKAGTSVTVFNGDTKLGVAQVDANGHFSLDVKIGKGAETLLTSIATDATGRSGLEAKPIAIEVGTGAEIGAKLQSLIAQGNVAKIVITDGTVLSNSSWNFSYINMYGKQTLANIQGDFSYMTSIKTSNSTYDRLDSFYDKSGTLLQFVRYNKGVEVYREIKNADGSKQIVDKTTAGQTSILDVSKAGVTTLSEQYNAAGIKIVRNLKNEATGATEQHIFDGKTGLETKYVLKAADGSRVEGNLQLKGRAFTSEIFSYDKAGKMIKQERYDADGTKIYLQTWKTDGGKEIHNYDAVTGKETGFTVYKADGSRVETTLKSGQPDQIVKTISYDASGKVIAQTTGGTVPTTGGNSAPIQVPTVPVVTTPPVSQTPAAGTVYTVDAKTKLKTGYTQTASDGSKTVVSFKPGQEDKLLKKDVFFANGKTALSETYDGAGHKLWSAVYKADGSHVNTQYGLKGAYDTLQNSYDASDKVVASTKSLGGKVVSVSTLDKDGTRLDKTYATDGSWKVTDKSASGKVLWSESYDKLGNKIAAAVYNADGSSDATAYDTLHRKVSSTSIEVDKSKDVFTFSYAGAATTASNTQHDHYQGSTKVWTDVTDASGAHLQTSYAVGAKLVSHAGVSDTFVSGGKDTFVFGAGAGKDVIKNFTVASASHDTILFDHAGVDSFSDLHFAASGKDTVITFGTTDSITVQNVAPSQLKPDFFLFT